MQNAELAVHRLTATARLPHRATPGSAGYDICADIPEPVIIPGGGMARIKTGLALQIPAGAVGLLFGRSGLGLGHGIVPANAVGVIDSDYRGEVIVGLRNQSGESYTVSPGDRIAQLVLLPALTPPVRETQALDETARAAGGFGSTGR